MAGGGTEKGRGCWKGIKDALPIPDCHEGTNGGRTDATSGWTGWRTIEGFDATLDCEGGSTEGAYDIASGCGGQLGCDGTNGAAAALSPDECGAVDAPKPIPGWVRGGGMDGLCVRSGSTPRPVAFCMRTASDDVR